MNAWIKSAQQYDDGTMEYVVSCEHFGVRFYLTDNWASSDLGENARVFGRVLDAAQAAREARDDPRWRGLFDWQPTDVWNGIAIV